MTAVERDAYREALRIAEEVRHCPFCPSPFPDSIPLSFVHVRPCIHLLGLLLFSYRPLCHRTILIITYLLMTSTRHPATHTWYLNYTQCLTGQEMSLMSGQGSYFRRAGPSEHGSIVSGVMHDQYAHKARGGLAAQVVVAQVPHRTPLP